MAIQKLNLSRDQLASFLQDFEQIKQFENLFSTVDTISTVTIDEIGIAAGSAFATANEALSGIATLNDLVAPLVTAPPPTGGTVTSVDASGGSTGLTLTGGPITTSGALTLGGTLDVNNGGTGQTSYTNGQLLIGNTTGNTLTPATLTAGANITITNGTGSISIAVSGLGTMAFQNVGVSGTFTTADIPPQTVTVTNGIITNIV
jgi:hypothetical protein